MMDEMMKPKRRGIPELLEELVEAIDEYEVNAMSGNGMTDDAEGMDPEGAMEHAGKRTMVVVAKGKR